MKFKSAAACESVVWQMRLADYSRGLNRSKLNALYNGEPPYSEQEEIQDRRNTNVNFLEGTKILHDARRQFSNAMTSSPQLFTVGVDHGPVWKRREWGGHITNEINRIVRRSRCYLDCLDNTFASVVLHGVGPVMWEDRHAWCPYELGIEDVLVPGGTYVSLRNLPFFAVFRQYTAPELWKKTHGPKVDPAWNKSLVDRAISWVDQQAKTLMGNAWPTIWSPEKMQERIKEDGGWYGNDRVPTIDTFDLYFWNDNGKKSGWNRRIILDAWGSPGPGGLGAAKGSLPDQSYLGTRNEFLYDPGDRVYADNLEQIIHFQFADASCVAPFRYHSVRSLGFLLYAVCHLQNRLRCRFNDAVFESLMQYFRVANPADAQRLSKIDLIDKGVVPDGAVFVKPDERWQYDAEMAQAGMGLNRQTMADNSASFTQDFDFDKEHPEETATRTMAKVNATAALVGAMLNKSYNQQAFQYLEMARRFCIPNSPDPDVRQFRLACLKAGVPEAALDSNRWDVQPVRVVGSGNKMLQVAMADKLMVIRPLLDPEGQKTVQRIFILANSDDPALADQLVPQKKPVSDTVIEAQNDAATLMLGLPLSMKEGTNHVDYIEAQLHAMAAKVDQIEKRGGMATADEIFGLGAIAANIEKHIGLLAQDQSAKERVKKYGDDLGELTNMLKAYQQRLAEQQQKQAQAGQGPDPEAQAKIQATVQAAEVKRETAKESAAQKTAQKQIQFEQAMKQDAQQHEAEMEQQAAKTAADIAAQEAKAAAQAQAMKDKPKPKPKPGGK